MFCSGSDGGVLQSLLCFVPGIGRRKAWNDSSRFRNLVRSISKNEVSVRRITKHQINYYGTSSSSEEEDDKDNGENSTTALRRRVSLDDGSSCSPAFLKLPPRPSDATDSPCEGRHPVIDVPDIVIHNVSDPIVSNGGLLPDESLDDLNGVTVCREVSPEGSLSSWVSPVSGQAASCVTANHSDRDSVTSSDESSQSDSTATSSHRQRPRNSEKTTCRQCKLSPGLPTSESGTISYDLTRPPCPHHAAGGGSSSHPSEPSDGPKSERRSRVDCEPAMDAISTSSTDSRSLSYVSAPQRPKQQPMDYDNTDLTDTTFWSTDSEADDELGLIISRENSCKKLGEVVALAAENTVESRNVTSRQSVRAKSKNSLNAEEKVKIIEHYLLCIASHRH